MSNLDNTAWLKKSNPSAELASKLRGMTPARVAMGRSGVSQRTPDQLAFQLAHARARDAVHARLDAQALARQIESLTPNESPARHVSVLHSAARDRAEYLQRPDLGRQLAASEREKITARKCEIAIIVVDGLSALAVERNAVPVLAELQSLLSDLDLQTIAVVEQGRVAIGDEIGALVGAQISIVLIGERPGLSSPDSLGVYITWKPRVGRSDAERNCISNIRSEGLSAREAATQIAALVRAAQQLQLTGVQLKVDTLKLSEG